MEKILSNIIVNSYKDVYSILNILAPMQTGGWHFFYRGHANEHFKLLPTIGRKKPLSGDLAECEQTSFNEYKQLIERENWERYKPSSFSNDLFLMSIGRHLGLVQVIRLVCLFRYCIILRLKR